MANVSATYFRFTSAFAAAVLATLCLKSKYHCFNEYFKLHYRLLLLASQQLHEYSMTSMHVVLTLSILRTT
jgi:hypothetical protein